MRLAIVYHRPFYQDADGGLWEAEGSFSRYVESLARFVDEVYLIVPRAHASRSPARRTGCGPRTSSLRPLPFYDRLPAVLSGAARRAAPALAHPARPATSSTCASRRRSGCTPTPSRSCCAARSS